MFLNLVFQLIVLHGVLKKSNAASAWSYEGENGVSKWSEIKGTDCSGKSQSPVAIMTKDTSVNNSLGTFDRSLFDAHASAMLIKNTKHSLQIDITDGYIIDNPSLLPGSFKAAQFHIHWGKPNAAGSEHTLNGVQYFGELHIVHYNTKYSSLGAAASKNDGLAVLGVFLKDDYPQDNLAFERFLGPVTNGSIRYYPDNQTMSNMFSVETLLPGDLSEYYRYQGSLTTPPCYESVVWTVFAVPLRISKAQARVLRNNLFESKEGEDSVQLYGNFRPVQPLNGRVVTRTSAVCSGGSSAVVRSYSPLVTSVFILVSLLMF